MEFSKTSDESGVKEKFEDQVNQWHEMSIHASAEADETAGIRKISAAGNQRAGSSSKLVLFVTAADENTTTDLEDMHNAIENLCMHLAEYGYRTEIIPAEQYNHDSFKTCTAVCCVSPGELVWEFKGNGELMSIVRQAECVDITPA
jgi:hypothetical protein